MTRRDILREFLPTVYEHYGPLNARQYAYRAEAAGLFEKSKPAFNEVNKILVELRESGVLPWSAVLDSSRKFKPYATDGIENAEEHVDIVVEEFKRSWESVWLPRWYGQQKVPVIITEKEGLIPYFELVTRERETSVYAIKGQAGKSHLHEVFAPWLRKLQEGGRQPVIFYLGDCDDEGFQIQETLDETLQRWIGSFLLKSKRLVLNEEQCDRYGLRKHPVKPYKSGSSGSKIAGKYVKFKSELEALDPTLLRSLIIQAVDGCFDERVEATRQRREKILRNQVKIGIGELARKLAK